MFNGLEFFLCVWRMAAVRRDSRTNDNKLRDEKKFFFSSLGEIRSQIKFQHHSDREAVVARFFF